MLLLIYPLNFQVILEAIDASFPVINPSIADVIFYLIIGGAGFAYLAILSVCILRRQRYAGFKKRAVLIEPRTSIALKYENEKCPGGLKNSPSSLSSPFTSDSSNSSPVVPPQSSIISLQPLNRLSPSQLGPHRGFINFTLHYSVENSTLQVNILNQIKLYIEITLDEIKLCA